MGRELVIGVDGRAAAEEIAGRGRVARELLRALAACENPHRYRVYGREAWDEPLGERFGWRTFPGGMARFQWRMAAAAGRECDVFLAANSYPSAILARVPAVTIVYDMVVFDRTLRPPLRSLVVERLTLAAAVRRSEQLLAISQATADMLVDRLPGARERVTVMPLGVSPAFRDASGADDGERDFVLAVGTLEPRKNFPRLVEAYRRLPEDLQRQHPLVVAGRIGWDASETMKALRSLGERCRLLGPVDDEQLAGLYRRCAVFCYPSLAEGFGLPVLEAMAAGAAVLTSDRSSLPEVGGDAVAYVDPTHPAAISSALAALLGDPERRARLSERARARAAEFSWDATAATAVTALERAAG
jgi:glycosyltransferase involved in cell wall biosynthesis